MDLNQTIQTTRLFQDVEFSQAVQELSRNPQALQTYLQQAQNRLYNNVTSQKDNSISKAYGDLNTASTANQALLDSWTRAKQTETTQDALLTELTKNASATAQQRDVAKRQVEINEWAVGNKRETLFVYQALFIGLCLTVVLTYLLMTGVIGHGFYWPSVFLLAFIFALIVANRAQYTIFSRNKRYWNRRNFKEQPGVIVPMPDCQSIAALSQEAATAAQNTLASAQNTLASVAANVTAN